MNDDDFTVIDRLRAKIVALEDILDYCNDCTDKITKDIATIYNKTNGEETYEIKWLVANRSIYINLIHDIKGKINNAL